MYDINTSIAEGEVMDLEDEGYFTDTTVLHATSLEQLRDCDAIVITAGAKQRVGETRYYYGACSCCCTNIELYGTVCFSHRATLLQRNAEILKSIIDGLMPLNSSTALILVTNPVDVLTMLAQKWTESCLPKVSCLHDSLPFLCHRFISPKFSELEPFWIHKDFEFR